MGFEADELITVVRLRCPIADRGGQYLASHMTSFQLAPDNGFGAVAAPLGESGASLSALCAALFVVKDRSSPEQKDRLLACGGRTAHHTG